MGRGAVLSDTEQAQIEAYFEKGLSFKKISEKTGRHRKIITNFLRNKKDYGKRFKGGTARVISDEDRLAIVRQASSSKISSTKIKAKLGVKASLSTIQRVIRKAKHLKSHSLKKKLKLNGQRIDEINTRCDKMLQNVCRICATEPSPTAVTKLFEESSLKLLQQINLVTGIFLEAKSDLPEIICNGCLRDLHCAISFRRRCLHNQKRWTSLTKSKEPAFPVSPTEIECPAVNLRRSERSLSKNANRPEFHGQELTMPLGSVEVLIKVEPLLDDNGRDDDGIDHLETENSTLDDSVKDASVVSAQIIAAKSDNENINPLRSKQKIPVFFCDQCGHNISGKSAFDRHIRKHNGIRPFQCELCAARFLSAGELKGHQVKHTGDRKFPCRYCERSYVNYSGRLRHERTHTNERPYECSQCGKTFSNSYILKNHMLVHTGERMFRCDLCERSFSRQTHLNTHYRSNTHKQNMGKEQEDKLERHSEIGHLVVPT